MNTFLWFVAWVALWALLIKVVIPWHAKRKFSKGWGEWDRQVRIFDRNRLHPVGASRVIERPKSLEYDPTDPDMNRGYVPGDDPEES